jgi:hypothetical protein
MCAWPFCIFISEGDAIAGNRVARPVDAGGPASAHGTRVGDGKKPMFFTAVFR